jgi:hypothetical protein
MRSDCLKVDQTHLLLQGISKQVKLSLTAKFVNQQLCKVAFFPVSNFWILGYLGYSNIYIDCDIFMQLLVLPRETSCLKDFVTHSARLRGTKGMASSRGSASEANDSAIKLTGKSGLSSAARPTFAQYSTWPEMVRCSAAASAFACS